MSTPTADEVRAIVKGLVNRRLRELDREPLGELEDNFNLLGALDSLFLVVLITDVAQHFSCQFDFADLDPEKMTAVGPLCEFLSSQLLKPPVLDFPG